MESNNYVKLLGKVNSKPEFSHEVFGEKFYTFHLALKRLSEEEDIIEIMISDRVPGFSQIKEDVKLYLEGQYRSYNKHENEKSRLLLSVFVKEIEFADENEVTNLNSIILQGFICKPVIYRKTPFGREVADILVGVNRPYGKSDYIPCIVWGRNARWASGLAVGNEVKICGRIQSREYVKKLSDEEFEERTAYEVSGSKIELV